MSELKIVDVVELVKGFDPNYSDATEVSKAILPSFVMAPTENSLGADAYVKAANAIADTEPGKRVLDIVIEQQQNGISKGFASIMKGLGIPGDMLTYARMSYMPDTASGGILQWPGVHPEAIKKIVRENIAPNLIIQTRLDDVLRYSQLSTHSWRPGWRIEVFQGRDQPSQAEEKEMREAEAFLNTSCDEFSYSDAIAREKSDLTDFQRFCLAISRDSLTFDGIAINTERDANNRVKKFSPLPASNMRLVGPEGYDKDPKAFIVAVDEGGKVIKTFHREDLIWYVRNVRTDPEYTVSMTRGYGTPEIDMTLRLIQGVQHIIDYNCDIFNRNGTPNGMLLLTGNGWTQRQVDVLTRMWHNLKRGITKAHAIPVLAAPQQSTVEIVDFSKIKGNEALYQDMLNLMIGMFCTMFRFPVGRFGYRITGNAPVPKTHDSSTSVVIDEDNDPGLVAFLIHLETLINENFIWPRWANLKFVFTGKNPKEAAREYEFKRNALTYGEARTEVDLPKLESLVKNKEHAELAELLSLCPIDANLSGVYQSIVATYLKAKLDPGKEDGKQPGATMGSKRDPATSESHGHMSGVRRDSKQEGNSAAS